MSEAAPLRFGGGEPGPVRDCADCVSWQPSPIVLRGNTRGWCLRHGCNICANDTCPLFERMAIPREHPGRA